MDLERGTMIVQSRSPSIEQLGSENLYGQAMSDPFDNTDFYLVWNIFYAPKDMFHPEVHFTERETSDA